MDFRTVGGILNLIGFLGCVFFVMEFFFLRTRVEKLEHRCRKLKGTVLRLLESENDRK